MRQALSYFVRFMTSPRIKSLAWRCAAMIVAVLLGLLTNKDTSLNLSPNQMVFFGLILGEISKALNNVSQGEHHGLLAEEELP